MVPGFETVTSEASFAFLLSVSMLISIAVLGFALHNVRYLAILYPTGTPAAMAPFIIAIELISYCARAVSLGMRLFANMFAGHALVKILMSFTWLFLTSAVPLLSIPVFALLLLIFMLECGIAYLQSYVFATLSGMYIEDVISLGH
jgi:F-type H+-transporting ATPase subunit a